MPIFPASHYITPKEKLQKAVKEIRRECDERVAFFKSQDKLLEAQRIEEEKAEARELCDKINATEVTVKVKCMGADGKMFGSATNAEIAGALKEQGIDVDKKKIVLKENIKAYGDYVVAVKLYAEISAKLKVHVVREVI